MHTSAPQSEVMQSQHMNNVNKRHTFLASEREQFNISRVFIETRRTLRYVHCPSHNSDDYSFASFANLKLGIPPSLPPLSPSSSWS